MSNATFILSPFTTTQVSTPAIDQGKTEYFPSWIHFSFTSAISCILLMELLGVNCCLLGRNTWNNRTVQPFKILFVDDIFWVPTSHGDFFKNLSGTWRFKNVKEWTQPLYIWLTKWHYILRKICCDNDKYVMQRYQLMDVNTGRRHIGKARMSTKFKGKTGGSIFAIDCKI